MWRRTMMWTSWKKWAVEVSFQNPWPPNLPDLPVTAVACSADDVSEKATEPASFWFAAVVADDED